MMDDRLMTGSYMAEDSSVEQTLRPHTLRDYVGQQAVKSSLDIYIQAALSRHDALDHMLPARPGKNHPRLHRGGGNGTEHPRHQRPGH